MKFYWKNKHYSSIYLTVDKKKKLTITYYRAGKLQSKDTIKNLPMSVKKLYSVFKKNKHLLKFGRVPESKIKQSL